MPWTPLQDGYLAYYRVGTFEGTDQTWLAFRFELFDQVGIDLPGIRSSNKFTRLAKSCGLLATEGRPGVPTAMLSGGKGRLLILSPDLINEILATPGPIIEKTVTEGETEGQLFEEENEDESDTTRVH